MLRVLLVLFGFFCFCFCFIFDSINRFAHRLPRVKSFFFNSGMNDKFFECKNNFWSKNSDKYVDACYLDLNHFKEIY